MFGALVALGSVEAGLRLVARDGAVFGVPLVPYAPPRERGGSADAAGYIRYDPETGWSPRPLSTDPTGLYCSDQHGLRAPAAAPRELGDAPRVVLFGDSFAHSDEVPYAESLVAALEPRLDGLRPLTAGVPAYGTDQAYLRYLATRDTLRPRVVVILVHQNDFFRNVALWTSSGYSKPRFVVADAPAGADGLTIVNRPPLAGRAFTDVFSAFESWELARHSFRHVPGVYDARPTDALMSLRLVRSALARAAADAAYRETVTPGCTNEAHVVTERVVRAFVRSVEETGAAPVVVAIPSATHLVDLRAGRDWWSATLQRAVAGTSAPYLDLTPDLLFAADKGRLPAERMYTLNGVGHFTGAGNALVADALAPVLLDAAQRR